MNIQAPRAIWLTLFLVSCALVLALGGTAIWLQTAYYQHNPYFYDPVVYSWENIRLFARLSHGHRLELALTEWLTNPKFPLRTVPLILFAPKLLANELGYVATALPAFLVFLVLLGWTIYQRSRSLAYALASTLLCCAIPGLLNGTYGLGAYWLDLPAAFWVGAAALAILNFIRSEKLTWLMLASTLAACATLSRYIAIAYVIIVCAPVLGYALLKHRHQGKSFLRAVLLPIAASLAPLLLLAGYYLVAQFGANYEYYTKFGYALKQPPLESFLAVSHFLINNFIGLPLVLALLLIVGCHLALIYQKMSSHLEELLITSWYGLSVVLFLVAIGTKDAFQSMFYAVPLIFFAAVSPIALPKESFSKISRPLKRVIVPSLIVFALLVMQHTITVSSNTALHPVRYLREQNRLDFALGRVLSKEAIAQTAMDVHRPMIWETFFDEHNFMPSLEAFYQSKKLVEPAFKFTVHETYWKALYPGLDPTQMSLKVYQQTTESINVIVVLEDPAVVSQLKIFDNPYTRSVAAYMATQVPKDTNWKALTTIKTKRYGRLIAYRNQALSKVAHGSL